MATQVKEQRLEAIDDELQVWERAGLISSDQSRAIHDFESNRVQPTRVPMVVEVLVYLGVAAVLGAAIALAVQRWDQFGFLGRSALFVTLAIGAGIGGAVLRGSGNTPSTRAASVLWALSVGFAVAVGGVVVEEYRPAEDWQSFLIVSGPAFLLASGYWQVARRPLQLLAVTATLIPIVLAGCELVFGELNATIAGLALASVGAAGIAISSRGWIPPRRFGEILFSLTLMFGVWTVASQPDALWAEVLGIAISGILLALSVRVRSVRFLGVGGVGLFGFVTMIVMRHFAERIGVPLALLISGIGLIGAAILVARLRLLTTARPDPGLDPKGVRHV